MNKITIDIEVLESTDTTTTAYKTSKFTRHLFIFRSHLAVEEIIRILKRDPDASTDKLMDAQPTKTLYSYTGKSAEDKFSATAITCKKPSLRGASFFNIKKWKGGGVYFPFPSTSY